jgi:autotransporter translocation and assembly factor TamB
VAFAPGATVNGRVSADVQARGPATKPNLTGTIAGRDLEISGQGIPQPVQVRAVNLTLSPTAIRSNEFNATSGKTTVVGRFSLLQYASAAPSIDFGLRAPGATLPEIQSIAKAYGVTGLDQITGEGAMDFDLNARGPLKSLSSADATRALNGTINLNFSPVKIAGFDTAHELSRVGGFASNMTDQGSTEILRLIGQIVVKNGIAQTDNLQAQLGIGNLVASGTADLATETLNLKLSAVFTKAFSDKIGASRAGGFMNAALSNTAGELVIPALVTGNFTKPSFAPDLQAVAQMQRQRFLPTLSNPAGAVSSVLETLTGKPKEGAEQGDEQQQRSPIQGILNLFGRKREAEK